jgi:hypothetical protein
MKTKKKKGRNLYLQTRNNRWKWMAGATAATAAGVTASQASTITINLVNNYISATGGNHLNADLTGDGHSDLTIANPVFSVYTRRTTSGIPNTQYRVFKASVKLDGILASAYLYPDRSGYGRERLGPRHTFVKGNGNTTGTPLLTGSIPLFFKDLHINGGARTHGLLGVTVRTKGPGLAGINLDSLTYTSPATAPDQGSSLALLAMGAGGILALRRWKAAQEKS